MPSSKGENAPNTGNLLDTWDPRRKPVELYNLKPHPVTGRLIDSHPGTRTRPMRVLCLGQSRSGTMSLFTSLQKLGYNVYHMASAMASGPRTNMNLWTEALDAKYYGKGKPWGREEFDKILGDYDAVADVPCICFVEELVAAYPEAKVVLSLRDVDEWLKSMDSTAGKVLSWKWSTVAAWDPAIAGPWYKHARKVVPAHFHTWADFSSPNTPARQAYLDHYEMVRSTVPKERLLEFKVQEGWDPLCKFLGVSAREEPFPRINDREQFIFAHKLMWWLAFGKMIGKISAMVAVPVGGLMMAVWWRSERIAPW